MDREHALTADTSFIADEAMTGAGLTATACRWWVIHTRVKTEKLVAQELARRDCRSYLPLVPVQHTYAKSRATFLLPLFPGYVFLHGDDRAYDVAVRLRQVANVLKVEDQRRLQMELRQIERVMHSGTHVSLYPSLRTGRRCRITRGPLQDLEGVVQRWQGRTRLYVAVTLIGQSAMVEIDAALLEPLD